MPRRVDAEANNQEEFSPAVAVSEGASKMMCQLLKLESAPDIDINFFSGNPMSFHYFMDVFNEIQQ